MGKTLKTTKKSSTTTTVSENVETDNVYSQHDGPWENFSDSFEDFLDELSSSETLDSDESDDHDCEGRTEESFAYHISE